MANPRPLLPDEKAKIRRLMEAGFNLRDTARELNRAEETVREFAVAIGLRARRQGPAGWTPERSALAAKLWTEGQSGTQIAQTLGGNLSRNAVLGRLSRMGLMRTRSASVGKPNSKDGTKRQVRRIQATYAPARYADYPRGTPLPPTNVAPVIIDVTHAKPWLERRFGDCAYPVAGEGADALSCCLATGGHTYCAGHRAVMFVVPKQTAERLEKWGTRYAA